MIQTLGFDAHSTDAEQWSNADKMSRYNGINTSVLSISALNPPREIRCNIACIPSRRDVARIFICFLYNLLDRVSERKLG